MYIRYILLTWFLVTDLTNVVSKPLFILRSIILHTGEHWSKGRDRPEMFLGKGVLKKLHCNFIEITLQHGCSPVHLLHLFRTPSFRTPLKNTSEQLLLEVKKNVGANLFISFFSFFFFFACLFHSRKLYFKLQLCFCFV